jgi:hypothetical protein
MVAYKESKGSAEVVNFVSNIVPGGMNYSRLRSTLRIMSNNINYYSNNITTDRSVVIVYDNNGDYKKGQGESGTKKYTVSVWTNRLEVTHTKSNIQMNPKHHPYNWKDRKLCPPEIIDFNNGIALILMII